MPKIDLEKLSLQELQQLAQEVEIKVNEKKTGEQQRIYQEIRTLAASIGMTLNEVIESQEQGRGRRSGVRAPAKVKYRNPNDPSQTWAGRGKRPGWVQAWINQGRELAEIEVQ
ncbi:MAG: H-NS family nucleoid-associated regulatory protein [Gammaproteobacteria bacterium]